MHELSKNVFAVGAQDWDRRLFDELIPLPDGTSYNSYLIKGSEKTALVDTVDPTKMSDLLTNLAKTQVEAIDYIVANHAEQDHSGSLPEMLMMHPEAKIVTNPKCKGMLVDHLCVGEDSIITVADGDTLSLGDKTLQFVYTPWVHWPETMSTYIREDRILLSCDFFGSHVASSEPMLVNEQLVLAGAKRYYAEIMMPFRAAIKGNLKKIDELDIGMIGPSHGPVYPRPALIIDAYKEWVGDEVKNEVVIVYVSMHESTKIMVEHLVEGLTDRGVKVIPFNLTVTDLGQLAMGLVDAATLVVASPTMLVGAHPLAAYAAYLANLLRPKTRFASIIGSYGWAGKMVEQVTGMMGNLKVEMIDPVVTKGLPSEEDYAKLDKLADEILARHKGIGIVN